MLRRMKQATEPPNSNGAAARNLRASSIFHIPSIFVGFTSAKNHISDGNDVARSPTSPLDLKPFSNLGNAMLRSPRSPRAWDCGKLGLGIVDSLSDDEAKCVDSREAMTVHKASVHLEGSPRSLPKDYGLLARRSPPSRLHPGAPADAKQMMSGELGKMRSSSSAEKLERSLSVSVGSNSAYIAALSAREVEQSEDYTCIISHGPNPKTTHIFGDCILEPSHADDAAKGIGGEKAEFYWLVKSTAEPPPVTSDDLLISSCFSCKKNLDGKDVYIYRGEKAFCSSSCRDQEMAIEEDEEEEERQEPSNSAFDEAIFISEMTVAT